MDGKLHADTLSHRVARRKRSSRHGTCEGAPMGTCIPVGQVQTRGSPEVSLRYVAKLGLQPGGRLGYPYCQVRAKALCSAWSGVWWSWARHFLFPWPHCLNLWQIGDPQGSFNLSVGMCLESGLGVQERLARWRAEAWPLALGSPRTSSTQPSPPSHPGPFWGEWVDGATSRSRDGAAGQDLGPMGERRTGDWEPSSEGGERWDRVSAKAPRSECTFHFALKRHLQNTNTKITWFQDSDCKTLNPRRGEPFGEQGFVPKHSS